MLRPSALTLPAASASRAVPLTRSCLRSFAVNRRPSSRGGDDSEFAAARQWLAQLTPDTIPTDIGHVSFSRSSGPGGQNVNKVSSKATLRIPLSAFLPHLPKILHPSILASRYLAAKSQHLVIQADESRKQSDNAHACFRRLHQLIVQAGRDTVPGETSPEQVKRIEQLQKAEAFGRRRMKDFQSKKKSARRGGGSDHD